MQRLPNATQRVLMALLIGVVTVPVSTTALFIHQSAIGESQDSSVVQAMEDRRRARAQQRSSWRITEQRKRAAEVSEDAVHSAAPEEDTSAITSLSTESLSAEHRAMLRTYTRARACPVSLKNFPVPGFYELCLAVVGTGASSDVIRGFMNYDEYLHRETRLIPVDVPAFKLRMQMLEQAKDSTRRRDGGQVPGRPTTCVSNPDCLDQKYGG